jgi:hypothetical protein
MLASGAMTVSSAGFGGLEVTIGGVGERARSAVAQLATSVRLSVNEVTRRFGDSAALASPGVSPLAVILVDGGHAASTAANPAGKGVVVLPTPDDAMHQVGWRVSYELVRRLLSGVTRPGTARESWFVEGTAAYYGWRVMRDAGVLADSAYEAALLAAWERYRMDSWIASGSIAQGGAHESAHRALVHDGGLLASSCLDATLRRVSEGERGLDAVLQILVRRFQASDSGYTNRDIYRVVEEVGGASVARTLSRWIEGSAPLALWRCSVVARGEG